MHNFSMCSTLHFYTCNLQWPRGTSYWEKIVWYFRIPYTCSPGSWTWMGRLCTYNTSSCNIISFQPFDQSACNESTRVVPLSIRFCTIQYFPNFLWCLHGWSVWWTEAVYTFSTRPFPLICCNHPQIGVLNIFSHTLVDSWEGVQWNDLSSLHPNSGMVYMVAFLMSSCKMCHISTANGAIKC